MDCPQPHPRSFACLDRATKEFLETQFQGQIIRRPWRCDVKAANASVIHAHNRSRERRGESVEPKFAFVEPTPGRLADLLARDFEHLCQGVPWLAKDAQQFVFVEIAGPSPNAVVISVEGEGEPLHAIGFRACLLRFLHAVYSKMWELSGGTRYEGCLEEHKHILAREEYSDTRLLAGFYNDIEMLFDQQRLFVPIDPPHWTEPYDYCGRVEGARRFILSHEIGHAIWLDQDRSLLAGTLSEYRLSQEQAHQWAEELWCDTFALQSLLAVYGLEPLEGTRLYDAEDLVVGVLQYMILMDTVELVLSEHEVIAFDHPPSALRELYLRTAIKEHPLYENSPDFRASVQKVWRRLRVFSRFIGGIGTPEQNGRMWSKPELLSGLSPFGRAAYNTIADQSLRLLADREAAVMKVYSANRRAIDRGFMPDPRNAPRFDDTF